MNNRYLVLVTATLAVVLGLWATVLAVGRFEVLVGVGIGAALFAALATAVVALT